MKIKQRHFIRKSELNVLKDEILTQYDQEFIDQIFPKKSNVELILTESGDILFAVNNELKLWKLLIFSFFARSHHQPFSSTFTNYFELLNIGIA